MSVKIQGLGQLQKKLKKLATNASKLSGEHQFSFPFSDLFPASFMRAHSRFGSLAEMLANGDVVVDNAEGFAAIPDDVWAAHVRSNTTFGSWEEMLRAASKEWTRRQLAR